MISRMNSFHSINDLWTEIESKLSWNMSKISFIFITVYEYRNSRDLKYMQYLFINLLNLTFIDQVFIEWWIYEIFYIYWWVYISQFDNCFMGYFIKNKHAISLHEISHSFSPRIRSSHFCYNWKTCENR